MMIDHLPNKSPKPQREIICFNNKNSFPSINGEGNLCSSTISYIYCYRE